MTKSIVHKSFTKSKPPLTSQPRRHKRTRKPAPQAPRRYWLDIGKSLSLALTAAKFEFDPRLDADQVDGGAE